MYDSQCPSGENEGLYSVAGDEIIRCGFLSFSNGIIHISPCWPYAKFLPSEDTDSHEIGSMFIVSFRVSSVPLPSQGFENSLNDLPRSEAYITRFPSGVQTG